MAQIDSRFTDCSLCAGSAKPIRTRVMHAACSAAAMILTGTSGSECRRVAYMADRSLAARAPSLTSPASALHAPPTAPEIPARCRRRPGARSWRRACRRVEFRKPSGGGRAAVPAIAGNAPPAPAANNALGITSSGFTATWSTAGGAIGYRLDVSTRSDFSTALAGYQDLDLGNSLPQDGFAAGARDLGRKARGFVIVGCRPYPLDLELPLPELAIHRATPGRINTACR